MIETEIKTGQESRHYPETFRSKAFAAQSAKSELVLFTIQRRTPRAEDVQIQILYCGVCHSDLHTVRDEWSKFMPTVYPCVPGHEIVGRVVRVGSAVTKFKEGDMAAVGCMVDSCRACDPCRRDLQQFCEQGAAWTYNSTEMDKRTPTYGGYSTRITASEDFILKIPAGLDPAGAAPLLCAGITTY